MSGLSKVTPIGDADAVFLDFDGTLSPLQSDPAAVRLSAACAAAIGRVAARLDNALAIVSGRDVRDLDQRTPRGVWRLGAHGLEACAPGEPPKESYDEAPTGLRQALARVAVMHEGVVLEHKGPVLAIHYRARPDLGETVRAAVEAEVLAVGGYTAQAGKCVIEAKPTNANKGAAIRRLMTARPFEGRRPIMVGDDATDEDAFEVVLGIGGVAIKVGEGQTRARERLADPEAVREWLEQGGAS